MHERQRIREADWHGHWHHGLIMILVNPQMGTEVETFTDEATKHLMAHGFYQKAKPNPEEKPKPKRTTRRTKRSDCRGIR